MSWTDYDRIDNSCIHQELLPIHQLGRNPQIYPLTAVHLRVASVTPDYLQFGMICITLSHRINRTRGDPQFKGLAEKFYLYWGLAVRSLNEHLETEAQHKDDIVLAGIVTLLLADVSSQFHATVKASVDSSLVTGPTWHLARLAMSPRGN
jgi:hypothetical protein